jgi:hypothetical protein
VAIDVRPADYRKSGRPSPPESRWRIIGRRGEEAGVTNPYLQTVPAAWARAGGASPGSGCHCAGDWTRLALAHKAVIDRFGRLPHRNDVLGRISTEDEIALLQDPTGSF